MADYFIDSSAVIKRYVGEKGTGWITGLLDPSVGHKIYVAAITGVEVVSALTRQHRGGFLTSADMTSALAQFQYDYLNQYQIVEIIPVVIQRAMSLAQLHALRGYDAVQLAAAVEVATRLRSLASLALTLISADSALNLAATTERLLVDDPNLHP